VTEIYGDRAARVVLFGSRARGDAEPDSDYDVAVFLRDLRDRSAEMNRLADVATDILYSEGEFIHAMPYRCLQRNHAAHARNPRGRHRPVKPQSASFLQKSREFLTKAQDLLEVALRRAFLMPLFCELLAHGLQFVTPGRHKVHLFRFV
jgi:predicted nucleotidyltransferase